MILDSFKLDGKVALITGAGRGLGRAMAIRFARCGADIVAASRTVAQLEESAGEVRKAGRKCLIVPTDVASSAQVNAMVAAALKEFGRIDVLVNNAGIGRVGGVESAEFSDNVRDTLQASLFGMVDVTQQVLPTMRRQGSGAIVNMSSVMGRKAFARFGSYAIVMHAVSAMSDALRQELAGSNIRVSVIYPALTATDLLRDADEAQMPPPFRHMTPLASEAVARAVVTAVRRGAPRVVMPGPAKLLLLGEAFSPRIGDLIASALAQRSFIRLVGMGRGKTYHQTIGVG
jgi:NAD(P)-dependent dehydrogenase (short-subunit alcohol dehydrogenase family)